MQFILNENASYEKTRKITDNVMIDYSSDGKVVGVELLDAFSNSFLPANVTSIPVEIN